MRRKVTLSLDERFIDAMDDERGDVPRSRWIERQRSPLTAHNIKTESAEEASAAIAAVQRVREPPTPKAERSPAGFGGIGGKPPVQKKGR
jgi:hypothetical protein